jgi:nucleotide-binding universal stress UspA family protein
MKILLAVDGSAFSDTAVAEVARRPWPPGSEIKVLSVFEPPLPPTPEAWAIPPAYFEELHGAALSKARNIVEAAIETLKTTLTEAAAINGEYVQGAPKSVILDESERWCADLIVVGSWLPRRKNAFSWALFRKRSSLMRNALLSSSESAECESLKSNGVSGSNS